MLSVTLRISFWGAGRFVFSESKGGRGDKEPDLMQLSVLWDCRIVPDLIRSECAKHHFTETK